MTPWKTAFALALALAAGERPVAVTGEWRGRRAALELTPLASMRA